MGARKRRQATTVWERVDPRSSDTPPRGREWLTAKIRWKTGRVRDDWSGKWQVLLILRWSVSHHWPLAKPSAAAALAPVAEQTTKRRSRRAQEAALVELRAEYPNGVPSRADEPDALLIEKVERRLTKKFGEKFSPKKDSILRAAGRRRRLAADDLARTRAVTGKFS